MTTRGKPADALPYPLGHRLCYKPTRRGTSYEAGCSARRLATGGDWTAFLPVGFCPAGSFGVAGGGRFALLSRVLAKARIAPVQADLQSVRLLHVLRGLHLAPQAKPACKRKRRRKFDMLSGSGPVAAGLFAERWAFQRMRRKRTWH
jgi:hypothetical protein